MVGGRSCVVTEARQYSRQSSGASGLPSPGEVELEPQDRRAEDPAAAQVVAHPRLDGAEVLADDERLGPVRLERQDADHGLVVVADVGPCLRPGTGGDPPQPEQPDDVVDADAARVPQDRRDHRPVRRVRGLGQPVRAPRGLAPVLAVLVVGVRGRADRDALRVRVLQAPRVGAARVHPDREVVQDAEAHPGAQGRGLGGLELLVEDPLQPALEVDLGDVLLRPGQDARRVRVPELDRPLGEVRPVRRRERRPDGEVPQTDALPLAVGGEGSLTPRGAGHDEQGLQRRALGRPGGVAVDDVEPGELVVESVAQPRDARADVVGSGRVFGDALDAEVERVREAARGGQVGRGFEGRDGLAGVQRVHEDVVGAGGRGRPDGQVLEVDEVADAPGLGRADAVELRRDAPRAALADLGREAQPGRRDDQGHGGLVRRPRRVGAAGAERVVTERQRVRDLERGLPHRPAARVGAVEVARRAPVLELAQVLPDAARLEVDPHLEPVAVPDVDVHVRGPALAERQAGRQHPGPGLLLPGGQRGDGGLGGARVDVERGEHRLDRLGRHDHVPALPVPVVGGDAVGVGQGLQSGVEVGHAAMLPDRGGRRRRRTFDGDLAGFLTLMLGFGPLEDQNGRRGSENRHDGEIRTVGRTRGLDRVRMR